jgi:hypothetical protein
MLEDAGPHDDTMISGEASAHLPNLPAVFGLAGI